MTSSESTAHPGNASAVKSSGPTIGLGIATRDRWEDLAETLRQLEAFGSGALAKIIIIDDGSTSPCPPEIVARYPRIEFLRDEKSRGYIAQRNRLAQLLDTDYYLSLDDDSCPVSGSFEGLVEFLQAHPEICSLAFHLFRGADAPASGSAAQPHRVKAFIGCGHLHQLARFRELGGYREELAFYNEEEELSIRIWKKGWSIVYYPGLVIRHRANPAQAHRNTARRAYYFARGRMLLTLWNVPGRQLPLRLLAASWFSYRFSSRNNLLPTVVGALRGLWDGFRLWRYRDPLPAPVYSDFRNAVWPPVA